MSWLRNSTVKLLTLAFIITPCTVTEVAGESVESVKRIISESGISRPLNKANWEEEFLANQPSSLNSKPVSAQTWAKIGEVANRIVQRDGKQSQIKREQLGANLKNSNLGGVESQINAALYDNFDRIQKLDSASSHSKTLSPKDISKLCAAGLVADAAMTAIDDLTFWADDKKNLKRFSSNASGTVSMADLKNAEKRNDLSSNDRAMLAQLESKFSIIAKDNVIGKIQIDSYFHQYRYHDPQYTLASAFIRDIHYVAMAQQKPEEHLLFKDQNAPLQDVTPDGVMQGQSPDCSFKAALIGFAQCQPAKLLKMMTPTQDGLMVTFPGAKEALKVPTPSAQEIGLFGAESKFGYWPTVMESAFGQKIFRSMKALARSEKQNMNDCEKASLDGYPENAIKALTGHKTSIIDFASLPNDAIALLLKKAQSEHRIIVMGTNPGDDTTKTKDGFSLGHAYAFVGIDNANTVTVRDPRSLPPAGLDKLSTATLKANFSYMAVESSEAL